MRELRHGCGEAQRRARSRRPVAVQVQVGEGVTGRRDVRRCILVHSEVDERQRRQTREPRLRGQPTAQNIVGPAITPMSFVVELQLLERSRIIVERASNGIPGGPVVGPIILWANTWPVRAKYTPDQLRTCTTDRVQGRRRARRSS